MKKHLMRALFALMIAVLLSSVVTVEASAASYPLVILDRDESTLTIPKGESGVLKFTVLPEYKNERLVLDVYNSSGTRVGGSSTSMYNTSSLIRTVTININTGSLSWGPGTYTVKYHMEFYSLYRWNSAPNTYSTTLKITEDICGGYHFFSRTIVDEATCTSKGKARLECWDCGYTEFETTDYAHTYDDGVITSNPTPTSDGVITYTCTKCGDETYSYIPAEEAACITQQPVDAVVEEGETAVASLTATGKDITYVWYVKNVGDAGFTKSSVKGAKYSVTMNEARSGRQVYCVVTDSYGYSVTSDVVTLRLPAELKITTQPKGSAVLKGETASVTVVAQGDGLKYAWYFKNPGATGFSKSSVTADTYSFAMDASRAGRQVYCKVSDEYGNSVKSDVVTLKMKVEAKITKQPVSVTVASGAKAAATVTAVGDGLKYAWYVKNPGATTFTRSSVATASYSVTMDSSRDGRQVYCKVTDKYGNSVISDTVTLAMEKYAKITRQPVGNSGYEGEKVNTTIGATGDGLKYAWYFKNVGDSGFTRSSVTADMYTVTMNAARHGRQVYCKVTDKYGNSVQSDTVTITMKKPATIIKQPVSASALRDKVAQVRVVATGDGLKYSWYFKNPGDASFRKSSLTGDNYSVTMDETRDGRQVYCVVHDKYGYGVQSDTVTLTMRKPAKITGQPANVTVDEGQTASVAVTATGDGLKYAWYFKNPGASKFDLSSVTSNTYSVTMTAARDDRQVYCKVTDKYGNSVVSNTVTLSIREIFQITQQPASVSVAEGATASVAVTATGDGLKYAWYVKNPGDSAWTRSSVSAASYSVTMNASRDGRQVYCKVTDQYGVSLITNTVTLSMK